MEIFFGIIIAIVFAELVSSVAHWAEDRYGDHRWAYSDNYIKRFIGKNIILPNIEHHRYPGKICQGGYWERNWTTIVPSLILAACFWWCWPICLGFVIMSQSNQLHSLSHRKCGPIIRFLQNIRVLNSPKLHKIHHTQPYESSYMVITGFMNPIFNFIRFWSIMEFFVWILTGAKPLKEREIY